MQYLEVPVYDEGLGEGFIDQAQRLYDVLIAGGERNWAGNKIDFGRAAEAIGQKAGKEAVSAIVEAARALREQLPESERDPEGAAERAEYEALVRQQQELAAQLEAKAKLMAELG